MFLYLVDLGNDHHMLRNGSGYRQLFAQASPKTKTQSWGSSKSLVWQLAVVRLP